MATKEKAEKEAAKAAEKAATEEEKLRKAQEKESKKAGKEAKSAGPKKNVSSYFHFQGARRAALKEAHPELGEPKRKKEAAAGADGVAAAKQAVFFYKKSQRSAVAEANPEAAPAELVQMMEQAFEALSEEERAPFEEKAAADLTRYEEEIAAEAKALIALSEPALAVGVEFVRERASREPAAAETSWLCSRLKDEHRILTSIDGPHDNVLVIKPPLCFSRSDAEQLVHALRSELVGMRGADLAGVTATPT
ncbi:hypothetical protein EMIHUDRAFT_239521 [Emiliania huxleyi CCMP1516]|uniref:HMG box domain-containing protein n=2 Tax=Emiliania huxleyi TaxID=2903 RepID=A0A0D3JJ47_EMIH1|nr:hypothetical protein EMIHUDRAFT_239521 [Emiliania huxleyi CCMP1516]EOD23532.1 hypothetical protein EMIHUDRAFT_239521 [Emiliania huxleyi CCMP1516]|eukprot:XP_005775961.1 hypothetical protein EMIHUDRAFT_239521 [Emiliania huxleyi CCMP1516]